MAGKAGCRFPLLVYRAMVDRWWHATFALGIFLLVLAGAVYINPITHGDSWRWEGLAVVGGVAFGFTILFLIMRSRAYVQAFPTYIKLSTPLMGIKISYKRLRKSTSAEVNALFPATAMKGWKYDVIAPLATKTALILELTGWPVPPNVLRMLLSSFFFRDKTPHFVLIVDDWMRLSMEIDSMRTSGGLGSGEQKRPQSQSILTRLPRKDS
jgi:hypothetical protein